MSEMKEYKPNTFCWPELMTTDPTAAKKFYTALFGWEYADNDMGEGRVYTMATLRGKNTGAMYKLHQQQLDQGVPANWLAYVSVANVDHTIAAAKENGATPIVEPMDVFDVGRMAMIADNVGATVALWQPNQHIGAELVNEHGALCWNELMTNDVDGSGGFYTKVFNWTSETADMGGTKYTSFMNGDRPAAGMMQIQKEWGDVPPHWLTYFAVDDCDGAVKTAESLGGNVLNPPTDIPEIGRSAVLQDPQGAVFAVIKLLNPQ